MMVGEQVIGFDLYIVEVCSAMVHGGPFPATTAPGAHRRQLTGLRGRYVTRICRRACRLMN
ncbi:hypothetical protein [Mucilaginibacter sp. FT3.2]|uniref:hypothetical protein n=1 Tax=Mucilaginibacter sp. FT3.2 TaxID=2723090 RepID=UPI00183AB5CC|nr:hypothetical protein [Mucilaginibacter sp. FT3.2]MBB6229739.1 hypothetical protein [Mucilaginibacter sp. FT3.2]